MSDYAGKRALKQVKGSVKSYITRRSILKIVKRGIKKAIESYNVKPREVKELMGIVLVDPLIDASKKLREKKLKPLQGFIEGSRDVSERNG
jgi:hypothetical protein